MARDPTAVPRLAKYLDDRQMERISLDAAVDTLRGLGVADPEPELATRVLLGIDSGEHYGDALQRALEDLLAEVGPTSSQ